MIHYIPDTNEKYSITKKGMITMHYNGDNINSTCNKKISFQTKGNNRVLKIVNSDKIRTSTTVDALIFRTFNYKTCSDCGSKIYGRKGAYSCVECNKRKDKTTLEMARVQIKISSQIIRLEAIKIKSERIIGHTNAFFKEKRK